MSKCVRSGCGKVFNDPEEENCTHHPGPPVFHEGQKGWKCCKPRVLTFEEFQNIPPCTVGKHSTTDFPPPIEKTAVEGASISSAPAPKAPSIEPTRVPINAAQATPPPQAVKVEEPEDDNPALPITAGAPCKRLKCGAQYTPEVQAKRQKGENEECTHHPGAPIFHEGSKGYSCCKRRVLEFDEFMKIEGCTTKDKHLFVGNGNKQKGGGSDGEELVDTVRTDFYQTPTQMIVSFFLKKISSEKSSITFPTSGSEILLNLVTADATPKRYKNTVNLYGSIDAEKSSFKIMGTKLELTLVKAEVGSSWPVVRKEDPRTGEIIQVGRAALLGKN